MSVSAKPIRFSIQPCSLGQALVALTDYGVCAITISDTREELINDLHSRFVGADLVEDVGAFADWVECSIRKIDDPDFELDVPLDVRGTEFQQRVWSALRQIPMGQTRSYSEVAAAIGDERATRAVASACGANSIAVAIPCHRVIRSDGDISGYRWGTDRKRQLLDKEQTNSHRLSERA